MSSSRFCSDLRSPVTSADKSQSLHTGKDRRNTCDPRKGTESQLHVTYDFEVAGAVEERWRGGDDGRKRILTLNSREETKRGHRGKKAEGPK